MTRIEEGLKIDQASIVRLESDRLRVDVAPEVGGRIVNLTELDSGYQFLWHNPRLELEKLTPGSEYDPNFYGGIDELLPNDIPEQINGIDSPDHGELWTTALDYQVDGESLVVEGVLPLCGLKYRRRLTLRAGEPVIDVDYLIENTTDERREFLWKLHAALRISEGDLIACPARTGRVVDPEWSRWTRPEPFEWPVIEGQHANRIPALDGTMDFLFIYDLTEGRVSWKSAAHAKMFEYRFDTDVFPYVWYFASYGGFDDHYVAILEPCTTMPLSVNEAAGLGQCSVLGPGEKIETRVTIYAGPLTE
ncbi:MAG: DUF5107 domain-containing protein [Chloroflexi bacterium]|nr:DUF5107 domain-containing protein [Chloroflexota bacterium]